MKDSAVVYYDFSASPVINSATYSTDYGNAHVGIFAEWESGRALPGQLSLPLGEYLCKFVITEESFHQSGLGGGWASVLEIDVNFITVIPDGDVNADGKVNAADILLAIQVALDSRDPTPEQFGHGDVAPLVAGVPDPDGLFDIRDVTVITRKALSLISF